jgi:hypothetical protein
LLFFDAATAVGAIAIASTTATLWNNENLAAVRRYFKTLLTFKKEAVGRYAPLLKTASKSAATKTMHLFQLACINEYPAPTFVLFPHEMN